MRSTLLFKLRDTPSIEIAPFEEAVRVSTLNVEAKFAVEATLTESLISRACLTASTYPFVTSVNESCDVLSSYPDGTLTTPSPFGESIRLPFVSVVEIVFPFTFTLSTSRSPLISIAAVSDNVVPLKVKLASSSTAPEVPAIRTLLFVKSETVKLESVVSPAPNVPLISALPLISIVVAVISTSLSAAIANVPSLVELMLRAESLN